MGQPSVASCGGTESPKQDHSTTFMDTPLFSSLFNNDHLCMLVVDPADARIVDANAGASRFYGYTREEFVRLSIADLLPGETGAQGSRLSCFLPEMHSIRHHRFKTGETRIVEMHGSRVMREGRSLLCYVVAGQTPGKCHGSLRREPERKYRAFFDMTSTPTMILDSSLAIESANTKFVEYFGYNPAELKRRLPYPAIVHREDRERVQKCHRRMAQDPAAPREYECRFTVKDGNVRAMGVSVAPIPGTQQSVVALQNNAGCNRVEEKLRENEERLQLLISCLKNHAVFTLTPEGSIGGWNEGAEKLTGYRKDEVLGKNLSCFYAPKAAKPRQYQELLAVARQGRAEWDGWWVKKDGAWFWAHVIVSGLFNNEGMIRGFTVILQDITENRRTEELLREREELYRTLIETSPEAIVLFDTKSRILMVNQRAAELFGYDNREDVFGESVYDYIVPEERQQAMERTAFVAGAGIKNRYYTFLKKDGTRFLGSLSASTIVDADGMAKFFIVMVTDVTEQRMAEEQIRNAVEEWRTTFDSLKDFVYILDRNMKITRINKACASAYCASPKELIGKHWNEVFHQMKDASFKSHYNKVIKCRKSITEEAYEPTLGSYQEVTISPIFDEAEAVIGTVHVIKDITERKKINDILRSEKEAIERLAIERTRELMAARVKLEQTKRLSDIGTLAATVAHELRNPLGVIRTAAYNIKRKNQNESLKGHLANIEKKILESDQIITNLLFYSRIKTPQHERVRLCALLEECIASARDRFHRWHVSIEGHCEEIVNGYITADPLQVTELFNNIINNAFESLPEKKGKIGIRGGYDGSGHMWISISDNGIGIDRTDLERITEPFFTKKSKGTGLGLTVCRQIVELHDGKMYIDSQKGAGTTVTISLPVSPAKDFQVTGETGDPGAHQNSGSRPPAERGK